MRVSIATTCLVALAAATWIAAPAAWSTRSVLAAESARAERVGIETPGVLRLSGSDRGLGTVSVACVDTLFGQRPEVRLVRPADPEPGRVEWVSLDLRDLLAPQFFDDETDGEIADRVGSNVWGFATSPDAFADRYELRLGMTVFSLDGSGGDFQVIGSADYQLDITCEVDPA